MKRKLISIVVLFLSFSSFAKDKNNFSIEADIGWNIGLYKEMTFSCVTQQLLSPKIGLGFYIENEDFFHKISMNYNSCRPASKQTQTALVYKEFDPISGESYYTGCYSQLFFHRINLTYDCLYKLPSNSDKFSFQVGGNFQANAYLQFENYPSITGLLSIGPAIKSEYKLNETNKFTLFFETELLGYGVRPPYAGCDALLMKYAEENFLKVLTLGDFLSLHNYQTVNLGLSYEHSINKLISLDSRLDFEYTRVAVPLDKPLYYLSSSFNTGITFKF